MIKYSNVEYVIRSLEDYHVRGKLEQVIYLQKAECKESNSKTRIMSLQS